MKNKIRRTTNQFFMARKSLTRGSQFPISKTEENRVLAWVA